MPRPTKPTALKLLQGTARPHRMKDEPEYSVTTNAKPPYGLRGKVARKEWERLVPLLEGQGVITEADLTWLCAGVNLWDAIQEKWESGELPSGFLMQQWRALYEGLGLSPSSRAKISRIEVGREKNPFISDMG